MVRIVEIIVCSLILIMDVAAGFLGLQAQGLENKANHTRVLFIECKEPVHEAYKLGLAAAILLGIAHFFENLFSGWTCLRGLRSKDEPARSSSKRPLLKTCLVFSWIAVLIGFPLLFFGARSNSKSRTTCGLSEHRFLYIGGILCFVHAALCLAIYVAAIFSF